MVLYMETQVLSIVLIAILLALFRYERMGALKYTGIVGGAGILCAVMEMCRVWYWMDDALVHAFLSVCHIAFGAACALMLMSYWHCKKNENVISLICGAVPLVIGLVQMMIREGFFLGGYAIFISLLILYCDMRYTAMITDKLTGLQNRYGMDIEIKRQLRQSKINAQDSFHIVICDMDNFKTINDRWGHAEGDRALILVAEALRAVAHRLDAKAFRIGGDEFILIIDTDSEKIAKEVCARIQNALDDIVFREDFETCMSMGVARFDENADITSLIDKADKQLYQVKRKNKKDA